MTKTVTCLWASFIFVASMLSAQTPVIRNTSGLPVEFLAVDRSEASIPEMLEFTLSFRNLSETPIFAVALNWIFEDDEGQIVRGGEFSGSFSVNPDNPIVGPGNIGSVKVLIPAETAEHHQWILPILDFVLFGDGTFTGPDRSQTLQKARTTFLTKRAETKRILDQIDPVNNQELAEELEGTLDALERLTHVYLGATPRR